MILLSILTPAMPSRFGQVTRLIQEIERQIAEKNVEHLILFDNGRRTIGEKRDALLRAARGRYVSFVDDDDWISEVYVARLLEAIITADQENRTVDVITFLQESVVNGQAGIVEFKLGNPNDPFLPGANEKIKRNAWHVCAWRRSLAILSHFPASNYGEDMAFASRLWALAGLKERHIPEVLHYYRHDSKHSLAPPEHA